MANDKIYPIDMGTKDILLQNEGGGGMIMNDQFIGIVGNMLPDQKELLDGQDNVNGTNIQTDKFSSNIIITNASSNPVGMSDLASKNFDSLDQSIGADQVVAPTVNNNCGGEGFLNYEFQELAKNIQLFRELWVPRSNDKGVVPDVMYKPKKGVIDPKYQNEKVKTEDQLKKFLIDQPIIDIIKSRITLDGSNFFNLFNYQKDPLNLSNSIKSSYTDRWIRDEDKDDEFSLGKVKDKNKLFKNNNTDKTEERSIFDIQTLPSGLRSLILPLYNIIVSNDWPAILLVAIGPEELNILTGLGITKAQAFNDNFQKEYGYKSKLKSLSDKEIYKKFFDQYDDIINAYNTDKSKFLSTVYKIIKEENEKEEKYFISTGVESQWFADNINNPFELTLLDIGLSIALKYADCPNEYEVIGDVPTAPTPSPSVTVTAAVAPPPTKSEEEEGIYNAEFLPATEDDSFQLFDDEYTANAIVLDAIAKDPSKVKNFQPKSSPPPNSSSKVDFAEISQWVKMYDQVQKDYNNGWTHPTYGRININDYLLQSIASACKATGIVATITTSKTGHNFNAKGGAPSRHHKGTGVDIAMLNGIWGYDTKLYPASGPSNMVPEFKRLGTILKDQLVADGHMWNTEKGYDKAVLFMTYTGGNHYNHLHVSNRILSAPGVKPKIIRE